MLRRLPLFAGMFAAGIFGGIFAEEVLWPYIVERPLFYQYRLESRPVNITQKEETIIEENTALQNAVSAVEKSTVAIKSTAPSGKTAGGSGVILTSDGLVLALSTVIPPNADSELYIEGKKTAFKVIKRDAKKNLVLIKSEAGNLDAADFADPGSLRFGQRVFLVASFFDSLGKPQELVDEGIIRNYSENLIRTSIIKDGGEEGSPLFNIEGALVGLNLADSERIDSIGIGEIKNFVGF